LILQGSTSTASSEFAAKAIGSIVKPKTPRRRYQTGGKVARSKDLDQDNQTRMKELQERRMAEMKVGLLPDNKVIIQIQYILQ